MRTSPCLLVVSLAACSGNFAPYNEVESLRILAIRSTPAWPGPGETATLDALVVAPTGESVTFAWSWCPVEGSASAGYPCLIDEGAFRAQLEGQAPGSGASLPPYDLGSAPTASLPHTVSPSFWQSLCAPSETQAQAPTEVSCAQAFPVSVELTVRTASEEVRARKTVRLALGTDVNANPTVDGLAVTLAGAPALLDDSGSVTLAPDTDYDLEADVPDAASESVSLADGSTSRERLLFTWFVDAGQTDKEHTAFIDGQVPLADATRNKWTTPKTAEINANPASVWVVVHDSRGGVGWTSGTATLGGQP